MVTGDDIKYLRMAIELGKQGMGNHKGGPFGALIVSNNKVIGKGYNEVTSSNDPTAHAEIVAIRRACQKLQSFQLVGATIYCSCEPCPMCLGAIYWARLKRIVFASTKEDAAKIGFDDDFIYREIDLPPHQRSVLTEQGLQNEGNELFAEWHKIENKTNY